MPLLPIALALAQFAPTIAGLLGGAKAEAVAEKVAGIAQAVTGQHSPDAALKALQADPNLALQFQTAVLDQRVKLEEIAAQRAKDEASADLDAARASTERAVALEGTASDLKAIPLLGNLMLFARGSQRPLIGFGTMYLDYAWMSGAWHLDDTQGRVAFLVNLLVLGFLFGERAVKNLAPLIADLMAARKA